MWPLTGVSQKISFTKYYHSTAGSIRLIINCLFLYLETNKIIYPFSHFEAVEIVFLQHKI